MVNTSAVLMSIKPVYSEAILSGKKTVELRRRRPAFAPGTQVLVYATAPYSHIIGCFETGTVFSDEPDALWELVSHRACVDQAAYDSYFDGCSTSHAIEVLRPQRLRPTPLEVRPPQSYMLLHDEDERHRALLALLDERHDRNSPWLAAPRAAFDAVAVAFSRTARRVLPTT